MVRFNKFKQQQQQPQQAQQQSKSKGSKGPQKNNKSKGKAGPTAAQAAPAPAPAPKQLLPKVEAAKPSFQKKPQQSNEAALNANWSRAQELKNESLFERAARVYSDFVTKELQKYKLAKADEAWMKKIMTEGTLKDKISALSIYIKDNPKTTLPAIENLMRFANTKSKKDSIQCFTALKSIFLESVMPQKAELKTFMQNTKSTKSEYSDDELVDFFYQHKLKEIFYRFINNLMEQLNDNLFFYRKSILTLLIDIVMKRNECQDMILAALLNKLGDSDKQVVTMINQNLGKVIYKKSELTLPLVKEIERFLFRPNIKIQSQFYAINFLNTINFATLDNISMKSIIQLLFVLFKKMIESNDEDLLASKILSQILRGINKIFPHTKKNFSEFKEFFNEKIEELYKLIHKTASIKIRIQTLLFIFQVENQDNNLTDRYYRVLYELIADPDVSHSSQTELFFDLLYFSLKADQDQTRIKSFIKRLLQHSIHCDPAFVVTSLIFVGKMLQTQPQLKTMIQQSERFFEDNDESFKDMDESDNEDNIKEEEVRQEEKPKTTKKVQPEEENPKKQSSKENAYVDYLGYDAFKREPRFSGCSESCFWELIMLAKHNHPTIKKFAEVLLTQQKPNIDYKGNPLLDFTVANFLDRFSFKSAKKKESTGMQSLKAKGKIRMSKLEAALQVDGFMKMDQRNLREEEKFFARYFQQKQKKREGIEKKPKKQAFEDDGGEIDPENDPEMDAFADKLAEDQLDSDFYDDDENEDDDFSDMEDDEDDDDENAGQGEQQQVSDDENDLMIGEDDDEGAEGPAGELESNDMEGDDYEDDEDDIGGDDDDEDQEDEDDFDLGDVDDLEEDLAADEEKMGIEGSDMDEDDIEDFGTLLEKAGEDEDHDDRKKFGQEKGGKVKKGISKKPDAKGKKPDSKGKAAGEKKPRHAAITALREQKKSQKVAKKQISRQNKSKGSFGKSKQKKQNKRK